MRKIIMRLGSAILVLVIFMLAMHGKTPICAEQPTGIMADFPPAYYADVDFHEPPEAVDRCYVYDLGVLYKWKTPPYGGEHVFYALGWSGKAVLVVDKDGNEFYVLREYFGFQCPENMN